MRLTVANFQNKKEKRNLVLINDVTHQRDTLESDPFEYP